MTEEGEIIYQNDFCIKVGSDESHFKVSVGSNGQSHNTVSTNHNHIFLTRRASCVALCSREASLHTGFVILNE